MLSFLLVTGSGSPEAVDPYLYGENGRVMTVAAGGRFATVVLVTTTGGFGPPAQAERLRSGLYGAEHFDSFEAAFQALRGSTAYKHSL